MPWTFIGAAAVSPWARLKCEREERAGAVGAVLGADRALVRFDDLPRDREAETGVVAEMLGVGTVGIEALEDAAHVAADARTFVG